MTGLLITGGILILLFIALCSYLDINLGGGFLSILGIAALIIIGFLLFLHYGGRSAQTMNPIAEGEWHRTSEGWEGSGSYEGSGYFNPKTGVFSKEPPADYIGEYDPEADRKYLESQQKH